MSIHMLKSKYYFHYDKLRPPCVYYLNYFIIYPKSTYQHTTYYMLHTLLHTYHNNAFKIMCRKYLFSRSDVPTHSLYILGWVCITYNVSLMPYGFNALHLRCMAWLHICIVIILFVTLTAQYIIM